jgi:hypothetical protein
MMRELLARMALGGTLSQAALELGVSGSLLQGMLERMEALGYVVRNQAARPGACAGCSGSSGCAGCGALGGAATLWALTDKGRKAASLPQ